MTENEIKSLKVLIADRRDVGVAYLLAFWFGVLGAHRFYLGQKGTAIIMLLLSLTIVGLVVSFIWLIIDLFLIADMTREYNKALIDNMP